MHDILIKKIKRVTEKKKRYREKEKENNRKRSSILRFTAQIATMVITGHAK